MEQNITAADIIPLLPGSLPLCPVRDALDNMAVYLSLLLRWNKKINLVGKHSLPMIVENLICDSFHLAFFLDRLNPEFNGLAIDAGAGAGLPGIPLRMVWQKGQYHMVEARGKRALFLASALASLKLPATCSVQGRIEKYLPATKKPDLIISRAFMPYDKLLPLFYPHVRGCVIIMANQPPPALDWKLEDSMCYKAANGNRWLWALTRPDS